MDGQKSYKKPTLDKDLDKFTYIEEAATNVSRGLAAPGFAFLFIILSGAVAGIYMTGTHGAAVIMAAPWVPVM